MLNDFYCWNLKDIDSFGNRDRCGYLSPVKTARVSRAFAWDLKKTVLAIKEVIKYGVI